MQIASVSKVVEAPIGEVWAVTSSFGMIRAWLPGIEKVSVKGAGLGAVRTVSGKGMLADETLTILDPEKHRVRYSIVSPGMENIQNFVGGTDLVALDDRRTKVTWVAEADAVIGDAAPLQAFFGQFINAGIDGIAKFLGVPSSDAA